MKKLFTYIILLIFVFSSLPTYADVLKGGVFENVEQELPRETFTGEFKEIDEKDVIEMTVDQVIDGNITLEGDEFFAKVTSDVGKNGVVLPKGTVAHGKIFQTKEARRLGRDGHITVEFEIIYDEDALSIFDIKDSDLEKRFSNDENGYFYLVENTEIVFYRSGKEAIVISSPWMLWDVFEYW